MKTTSKSTTPPVFFLGIDVGKADLFCHIIGPNETLSERFDNNPKGIRSLMSWLKKAAKSKPWTACLEQTGHYGNDIAHALDECHPGSVYLVNPQLIKAFGMQKLRRNKSDTADAKLIARFLVSEIDDLRPWQPKSPTEQRIMELSRFAESLTQDAARLKTMLEAQSDKLICLSLKRQIKTFSVEVAKVRAEINKLIATNKQLKTRNELIQSIPGIGEVASHVILAELPDLKHFQDARQLAAWAGVTPRHCVSGTSGMTRTPITKIGSARLRRGLFMPAMNARNFNPLLKEFAERLKENGKTPKQIIIAIMRKLLHQIYGILKSGEPFNPNKRGFKTA